MKKFTFIFFLVFGITLAQQRVAQHISILNKEHSVFVPLSPLIEQPGVPENISQAVSNATMATLDRAVLNQIITTAPNTIELSIPYNGGILVVQLYKATIFADGFHADTNLQKNFNYTPGVYYRGIIKGDESSLASFSFFEGELTGTISKQDTGNLVIGRLTEDRSSTYVIYSDTNLIRTNTFNCATADKDFLNRGSNTAAKLTTNETDYCVTIYFEIDYDTFVQNGSSQETTGNWLTSIFNTTQTLYDNDGIGVSLKSFMVWTTPDSYSGSDASEYLTDFTINSSVNNFDGDLGQLIGMDPGGLGGVAFLEGLCFTPYNVSYVDINGLDFLPLPLYTWSVQAIAHELGHSLGSPHTHDCAWNGNNTPIDGCFTPDEPCGFAPIPAEGGTIMSYCHLQSVGVNFANGFGEQPANLIKGFINASQCLSTQCAAPTCHNYITNIALSSISPTNVIITWDDDTSGPWQYSIGVLGMGFSDWEDVETPSVDLQNLSGNTYYSFMVRSVCDSGTMLGKKLNFTTDADWCAGQVFTGPNGTTGFYEVNQHIIRTLTPSVPGGKIKVDFSSFGLEFGYDFLKVYDGADTNAPLLGQFTGDDIPAPIVSGADDGALTFEFTSDEQVNSIGWVANVTCEDILGIAKNNSVLNVVYYPNPASTSVYMVSPETISEVKVYNTLGQLVLTQSADSNEVVTNISALTTGVYFFKVASINENSTNFSIVKK